MDFGVEILDLLTNNNFYIWTLKRLKYSLTYDL